MSALKAGNDWAELLRRVSERGAAFMADAVEPSFCRALLAEVERGPFEPVESVVGPVRQEAESYELRLTEPMQFADYPLLNDLAAEIAREMHEHGLPDWVPNEVAVQRYQPGDVGITPHRDQRRFALLVAVITVAGSAPFTLHRERTGPPTSRWQAAEGSLVLLRGPGLAGISDGRPMHAVGSPTRAPRTSIGLRMDTRDT